MSPTAPDRAFRVEPYAYSEARAVAEGLGVSDPVATTLVRRGYRTVDAAREFLEASESHDAFEFDGIERVCDLLLSAARSSRQITIHGDYDVDGVCSTAILVASLRELGAHCDWFIPDRLGDGYGLTKAGIARLAARGTELLLTADCGITSVSEIEAARAAGLEVIVTDHHAPGEQLPDCPIVHPRVSGYPCPDLCATGVAYKLSAALRHCAGSGAEGADADLDLVALATVADMVPLRGENRTLVRRGLADARRAGRVGLRALIAAAGVEPSRLDEGDLAFRLAPRINAAGRLYRADAGVELMLCTDEARAEGIAAELDRANHERRDAEREVLAGAEAALSELPGGVEAPALVVAGEGWHPGLVGIVASRLAERHWRPAIVIALEGGRGRGSGRAIPAFDLLGALRDCGDHLVRFGGHRAAAGLEIDADRVGAFRDAFVARAAEALQPAELVRTETVDAVVGGDRLGLQMAEELERLGPFGSGNPEVRLLVPAARMRDVRPMGDGKHARFSVESGAGRALGVAFGSTERSLAAHGGDPVDLSVRLEVNQWNGAEEPRVVLGELYPIVDPPRNGNGSRSGGARHEGRDSSPAGCLDPAGGEEWWERLAAERDRRPDEPNAWARPESGAPTGRREPVEHPGGSAIAMLADLVSSGVPVLALCADASRRAALAERADPIRFGSGAASHACGRCSDDAVTRSAGELRRAGRGLLLADWGSLARHPGLAAGFEHVVVVDPLPFGGLEALVGAGEGYLHATWGEAERAFALRVHDAEWELRDALRAVYRELGDAGSSAGEQLRGALAGHGAHPRTPEVAGRCVRVLEELGLVTLEGDAAGRVLRVVSSGGTELERSGAYRAYTARHEEGRRFLSRQRRRAA